jgi:glycosyltransferase involved in cell wall biosynthesis
MTRADDVATSSQATSGDVRPCLAIISNGLTPYRLHLHRRIAREIPELKLWSLLTHQEGASAWALDAPAEIGAVAFHAPGETSARQGDPRRAAAEWAKGGRVIRWLKGHDVRAVVMLGYNDAGRLRVIRWCAARGLPCFLFGDSNIRGDRATGLRAVAKRAVVGWVVRRCAGVLPCGTLGRDYFVKYGADPARIFFVPYEPDYDLIRNLPAESIDRTRDRFGLGPGRRRLVYSGRLVPVKRVDLLIDAFVAIADRRPEWDLLIVGDGPLRAGLEARVPAPIRHRVIWTGFVGEQADVGALYRLGDVLVLPSDYEPWALVVNEAAAAGLAVVASDSVGAAAELVRDGVNGRTFPRGDLPALTAALLEVTDPAAIDGRRAASAAVLDDWRRRADPVRGLRDALGSVGAL